MLSDAEKKVLMTNLVVLTNDFPYDSLIDAIISANIFDPVERSNIDSQPTKQKKNRHLFDTIQTKPPGTFKTLCMLYSKVKSVQAKVGQQLLQKIEDFKSSNSEVDGPPAQVATSTSNIVEGSKRK